MAGPSDLRTYVDAIIAAIESEDVLAAKKASAKAKAVLASIPDAEADGVTTSYRNTLAALDSSIKELEDIKIASSGGMFIGVEFR